MVAGQTHVRTFENYIGGRWVSCSSGRTVPDVNPADRDEILCEAQASSPSDVDDAMQAAGEAFPAWRRTPVPERAAVLQELVRVLKERRDTFARAITLENGKTLREAGAEFDAAVKEAEFQIGEGRRLGGDHLPSERPEVLCYVGRQALGVVTLITPWNFPLNVACRKLFPAVIAGNCCVLKPAEFTPMTAALLVEIAHRVGFPPGVINLVTGRARQSAIDWLLTLRCEQSRLPARPRWAWVSRRRSRADQPEFSSRWVARIRWSCSTMPTSGRRWRRR